MSYVVQFDATDADVETAPEERIHIINVAHCGRSKDQALEELLLSAGRKLDQRAGARLRTARPDIFETTEVPLREAPAEALVAAALRYARRHSVS
jgi:hypothetical protein